MLIILVAGVFLLVVEIDPGLWPLSLVLFGLWALLVGVGAAENRKRVTTEW